jgi:hypothetical protein
MTLCDAQDAQQQKQRRQQLQMQYYVCCGSKHLQWRVIGTLLCSDWMCLAIPLQWVLLWQPCPCPHLIHPFFLNHGRGRPSLAPTFHPPSPRCRCPPTPCTSFLSRHNAGAATKLNERMMAAVGPAVLYVYPQRPHTKLIFCRDTVVDAYGWEFLWTAGALPLLTTFPTLPIFSPLCPCAPAILSRHNAGAAHEAR